MALMTPPESLERAAIVVAHPDDEVLWFSSVLDSVGKIVFCFEHCADLPEFTPGRRRVVEEYPLATLTTLRVDEPCSVHQVDWSNPQFDTLGLRLNASTTTPEHMRRYETSYTELQQKLETTLQGVDTVFTHNPWGEYGHPDHVQVAAVVAELQTSLGFQLFQSGYIAPRTMPLASRSLPRFGRCFELPTRRLLADQIQRLYEDADCWTWPSNYQRFDTEVFIEAVGTPEPGLGFSLNCVTP